MSIFGSDFDQLVWRIAYLGSDLQLLGLWAGPNSQQCFVVCGNESLYNCERSELSGLFNGTDFLYFRPSVRRAVNVLNVSTCI